MKILAIDTSSKICSVAITEDFKKIIELHSDDEKTHSIKLMPMIDEAFKKTGLTLDDINLLACCVGPGSFTGIRIGIATVKAFADSKNIPAVGVSSLEGLSYNLIDTSKQSPSGTMFCSIIDAQNDNVYCGMYRDYNNRLNSITDLLAENIEDTILKIDDTINFNQITNVIFVGDGASKYKNILNNKLTASNCVFNFADENKNLPNSVSIAIAGYIKYKDNKLSSLSPLYLRKSQAERALEEKK